LFFDNSVYFRFVDACRARGISVPILPGIMPVLSLKQIRRFTEMCGATLPSALVRRLEAAGESTDAVEFVGLEWAITQVRELLANQVPGYHLYTLNRAKSALALVAALAA
jgi:methylenetetrahydrofolate reductase (NADPH)